MENIKGLEKLIDGNISLIKKVTNVKNDCYISQTDKGKFFMKQMKEKNLRKEIFGISFFGEFLNVKVPKIITSTEEVLITEYEDLLEEISSEEIVSIILNYQNDYWNLKDNIKDLPKINGGFPRSKINQDFEENRNLFQDKKPDKISEIIYSLRGDNYKEIPKTICHGDIRLKNVFKKEGNPFLLDFEKVCFDYPTFDISTFAYSLPEETLRIFEFYNSKKPQELSGIDETLLKDMFLSDVMRIAVYDTIYSNKKETYETRREHDDKVIDNLISLLV
jgi:hypothetical protein